MSARNPSLSSNSQQNATRGNFIRIFLFSLCSMFDIFRLSWHFNSIAHGGSAVFKWSSKLIHSCIRNCSWHNFPDQNVLVHRALRTICRGEPLSIDYLGERSIFYYAVQRREVLLREKYFACRCERCTQLPDYCETLPCPVCSARFWEHSEPGPKPLGTLSASASCEDEPEMGYAVLHLNRAATSASCCFRSTVRSWVCGKCKGEFSEADIDFSLKRRL